MFEHLEDGFALGREDGVFVAFALSAPFAYRLCTFVDVVLADGDVFVFARFLERVDMVLFAVVFAPLEFGEVFAQIHVVKVVAVALDTRRRIHLAYPFGYFFLNAAHDERLFSLFEIGDPIVHDGADVLLRAERLNGIFVVFPCGFDEKTVFIFRPFDVVRFAPHEQVRKRKVCIFAVLRTKI